MTLLEVNNLRKAFGKRGFGRRGETVHAVNDVSFTLEAGETLAVVGESGAGKSTVGLMVLRLLEADAGTIAFEGQDIRKLRGKALQDWRQHAQMVFQEPFGSFDSRMTIEQSISEPLVIHRDMTKPERAEKVTELLRSVGLDERVLQRYPYEFSGGQLQRMAIARAIACAPKLLVCDEPVAALDMSIRARVMNLLKDVQRASQIGMIFVSHDLSLVRMVADRTAVMYRGRIVEIGDTKAMYDNPQHPYTRVLLSAVPVPDPLVQRRRDRVQAVANGGLDAGGDACAFSLRCPYVMDICKQRPPLTVRTTGVLAACHLDELAPPDQELRAESDVAADATDGADAAGNGESEGSSVGL
jgi:oligopeptide transport system ATP-binding protein